MWIKEGRESDDKEEKENRGRRRKTRGWRIKWSKEEKEDGDKCMNLWENLLKLRKGNSRHVIGKDEAKNGKPLASIMAGRGCGVNNLCVGDLGKKKLWK